VLVVDKAIGSDQGNKFVYVIDKDSKAQYRRVTTGSLQEDGLRVITEGLSPDDLVVVSGLQQVRPRMPVNVEQVAMPSLGREPANTPVPAGPAEPTAPTAAKAKASEGHSS
jgi:membrane fusion protein, multidrug efflux system